MFFQRQLGQLVDHPWMVSLTIALISALSIVGFVDPYLIIPEALPENRGNSTETQDDSESSRPIPLPDVHVAQLGGFEVVLLVQSENLFTPTSAKALRHVVEKLEDAEQIVAVDWMDRSIPLNIFGLQEPVFPSSSASQILFDAARKKALANPMIGGFTLSDDARTTMLMIDIDWFYVREDADCTTSVREIAEAASREVSGSDLTFQITGRVPIELALRARNKHNERKYQIIANCFTLFMAAILFRGIIAVLIVAAAPGIGVFWTLGLLNFFDLQDNPFNHVVLPIMISLVGFTDGVHMMVQIRANRAAGHPPREATRIAIREVGLACALTSLTTAIGFGSLSLAHHEVVQEFGWCCVLGVIVTFISVVTVIPLLCITPLGKWVSGGHSRGLIDRHFGRAIWIVDGVLRHYRIFAMLSFAGLISLTAIGGLLRPDERRTSALPTTGEELVALRLMDHELGGLEPAEVQIRWSGQEYLKAEDSVPSDSVSPEVLRVNQEVEALLKSESLLGHPLSIAGLVQALPGEGEIEDRVSLMELLPPPLKRAFITPERRFSKVIFRVQDLGIARYGPVFTRVQNGLKDIMTSHPNFDLRLAGDAVWRWENLYQIVVDLALSLGTAIVIIFIVLTFVYRSLRIGLLSIVPNVFPLAATAAVLVFWGQSLEMVSVCAFTVCLGIAVDDTIHFLTRYNEERSRTANSSEAIRRSFIAVGTALIMTTIVLIAGFSTALTSDTRDHKIFAIMAILTIGSALFADLILLPALLKYFSADSRADSNVQD